MNKNNSEDKKQDKEETKDKKIQENDEIKIKDNEEKKNQMKSENNTKQEEKKAIKKESLSFKWKIGAKSENIDNNNKEGKDSFISDIKTNNGNSKSDSSLIKKSIEALSNKIDNKYLEYKYPNTSVSGPISKELNSDDKIIIYLLEII